MRIVRAIDDTGDWLFGKGGQDYKRNKQAVAQNIRTRLNMFLGDCFFATNDGIDWWNLLGGKNQLAIQLAVSTTIINTEGVQSLLQLSAVLDATRTLSLQYSVQTPFGTTTDTIRQQVNDFLLTEDGDFITTEDGDFITTG